MNKLSMKEMEVVVENRVYELVNKFFEELDSKNMKTKCELNYPDVEFSVTGTNAGFHTSNMLTGESTVNFNPIIMKNNWENFDQTIIHEVAHFCVFILKGHIYTRKGRTVHHGKDWKNMMSFFGVNPKRCHNYNISNVKGKIQRRWNYECKCQSHLVSTTIHNRIRKGQKYFCNDCRSTVEFIGE